MKRSIALMALFVSKTVYTVFNPTPGEPLWNVAAETGRIASAIEGTQIRIQSSNVGTTGFMITAPGRYALVENITYTSSTGSPAITIAASNVYLDLNGFTISASGGMTSSALIATSGAQSNLYIGNGTLEDATNRGILIGNGCSEVVVDRMQVLSPAGRGISILGASGGSEVMNVLVRDSNFSGSTVSHGMFLQEVHSAHIIDCVSYQNNVVAGSNGMTLNNCTNIIIDGCSLTDNDFNGIAINGCSNIEVSNCYCADQSRGVRISSAGTILKGENIAIESCDFFNHTSDAIDVIATSSHILIRDVQIAGASSGFQAGLVSGMSIENTSINNTTGGTGAVIFAASSDQIWLKNVSVQESAGTGFLFNSECNQLAIIDCIAQSCAAQGFFFIDPNTVTVEGCIAQNNTSHGFVFQNNVNVSTAGIVVQNCVATNNGGIGFWLGDSRSLQGVLVQGCVASQNGSHGFGCVMEDSELISNRSINNIGNNFDFRNGTLGGPFASTGRILVQDNVAHSIFGGSVNFFEAVGFIDFANMYQGNAASSVLGGVTNYTLSLSVPVINAVSSTVAASPASSRWENQSITMT